MLKYNRYKNNIKRYKNTTTPPERPLPYVCWRIFTSITEIHPNFFLAKHSLVCYINVCNALIYIFCILSILLFC